MLSFFKKSKILYDALNGHDFTSKSALARLTCERLMSRVNYESLEYRVNVIGDSGSGKSSLINNILGVNILPLGITPTVAIEVTCTTSPVSAYHLVYTDFFNKKRHEVYTQLDELHSAMTRLYTDITIGRIQVFVPNANLDTVTFVETPRIRDQTNAHTHILTCAADYEYDADFVLMCVTPNSHKLPSATYLKMDGLYKRWAVVINDAQSQVSSKNVVHQLRRCLGDRGISTSNTLFFHVNSSSESYFHVSATIRERVALFRQRSRQEFLDTSFVMMEYGCDPEFALVSPRLQAHIAHAKHQLKIMFSAISIPNLDNLYKSIRQCDREATVLWWDAVFNRDFWSHLTSQRSYIVRNIRASFKGDELLLSFFHPFLLYDFDAFIHQVERDFRTTQCGLWRNMEVSNRDNIVNSIQKEIDSLVQRVQQGAAKLIDDLTRLAECAKQDSLNETLYVRNAFVTVFEGNRSYDNGRMVYGWKDVVLRPPGSFSAFSCTD